MAFNPEVALFALLEDAQTAAELLQVIDDYIANPNYPPLVYMEIYKDAMFIQQTIGIKVHDDNT